MGITLKLEFSIKQLTLALMLIVAQFGFSQDDCLGTSGTNGFVVNDVVPGVPSSQGPPISSGGPCGDSIPHFIADLSPNADSTWLSHHDMIGLTTGSNSGKIIRYGDKDELCNTCCKSNPDTSKPARCVSFEVILAPDAAGIEIFVADGPEPKGALGWQLMYPGNALNVDPSDPLANSDECGVFHSIGDEVCLTGGATYYISFCKPGNDPAIYGIRSFKRPGVGPTDIVSDACSGEIYAEGYDEDNIAWTALDINYNPLADPHAYISSCMGITGSFNGSEYLCDSLEIEFDAAADSIIYYQVCGPADGVEAASCGLIIVCDTTGVEFIENLQVDIFPDDAVICAGSTVGVTLTAQDSGGKAPIEYLWEVYDTIGGSPVFAQPPGFDNVHDTTVQSVVAGVAYTYIVTVTDVSGCAEVKDTVVVVQIENEPTALANNVLVCENNPIAQLLGDTADASSFLWEVIPGDAVTSGTGDGTIDVNNILNPTYTPGSSDFTEIGLGLPINIMFIARNDTTCPADTAYVEIRIDSTPVVIINTVPEFCSNNGSVTLTASSSTGSGSWSGGNGSFSAPNSLISNYTPTPTLVGYTVDLYFTSTNNNSCDSVIDTIPLTIVPAPIVEAGPDSSLCANSDTMTFDNAVITDVNDGGGTVEWTCNVCDGSFNGTENQLDATYIAGPTDIANCVTLYLTYTSIVSSGGATCGAVVDTIQLCYYPAPTIDIIDSISVCSTDPVVEGLTATVTLASGVSWSGGGDGFAPNPSLITDFTPLAAQVTLAHTTPQIIQLIGETTGNGSCNAVRDTVVVTITSSPTVVVDTAAYFVCNDGTMEKCLSVTTSANWDPLVGSIFWTSTTSGTIGFDNNTNLEPCYTPTAAEVTATQAILIGVISYPGCAVPPISPVIRYMPAPIVDPANDTTCINNPSAIINGNVSGQLGGTLQWTSSSGNSGGFVDPTSESTTYNPSSADTAFGSVVLTLTSAYTNTPLNYSCDIVSGSMTLSFSPVPVVYAGPNQSLCSNNSIATTTNALITIPANGTGTTAPFWRTLGDGSFGGTENNLIATYTPGTQDLIDTSVCLVLSTANPGDCDTIRDTMCIIFTPSPTIVATTDTVCANNNQAQVSALITVSTGIRWTGGGNIFSPLSTTTLYDPSNTEISNGIATLYIETQLNDNCNSVFDSVKIIIDPSPTIGVLDTVRVCANNSLVDDLTASITNSVSVDWTGGLPGTFNPTSGLITDFTPSSSQTNVAPINITLTATTTGNGLCNAVDTNVILVIAPSPTANAGGPRTVCANDSVLTLAGSVTNAVGGSWISLSGNNAGFTDQNSLTSDYAPSSFDVSVDSVCLELTTTGIGNCSEVKDTMCITINPAPTVDAGTAGPVCENNGLITLDGTVNVALGGSWTSSVSGNFVSSASDVDVQFMPDNPTPGVITFTLESAPLSLCLPVTDQVNVTVTPAPTVNAGDNDTVCADNPSVTLNGSVTVSGGGQWYGGGPNYAPNDTVLNATYLPNSTEIDNGSVMLILQTTLNGNCSPVTDTMNIIINPAPTVDAGGPTMTVCETATSINLNGIIHSDFGGVWTSSSGNNSGFSSQTDLSGTYSPSATDFTNGFVTLTLTTTDPNSLCNPIFDTLRINFEVSPTIDAGTGGTFCTNEFPIQLNGTGSPAIWSGGAGNFSPNDSVLNAFYTPDASEVDGSTITLTLTTIDFGGTCTPISSTVDYVFLSGPIIDAGDTQIVCGDVTTINLTGSFGGDATGLIWTPILPAVFGSLSSPTNPTGTFTLTSLDIGNNGVDLIATSTGPNCPSASDTFHLEITEAPTVDAGFPLTVCADAGSVSLDGTVTVSGGGAWTSPTGNNFVNDSLVDAVYNFSQTDINNGHVILTLCSIDNGTCAQVCDTVSRYFTPAPTIDAGDPSTICADSAYFQLDGSYTVASGILWTTPDGTISQLSPSAADTNARYTPTAADTARGFVTFYINTFGVVGDNCIPIADTMVLTITPAPAITTTDDFEICRDQPSVGLSSTINSSATGVAWSTTGDGTFNNDSIFNPVYTFLGGDSIFITLTTITTGNGQCNPVTEQTNITINPKVTVFAGPSQRLCADASDVSLNQSNVTVATGGVWTGITGTGTFDNDSLVNTIYHPSPNDSLAGCVTLRLTSTGNGLCQPVSDTLEICFEPVPIANAGPNDTVCQDSALYQLNGSVLNAVGGAWSTQGTGSGAFSLNPNDTTAVYSIELTDTSNGGVMFYLTTTGHVLCSSVIDSMFLTITPAPTIVIDNVPSICEDNDNVTLNATVSVAGSVAWSSSGFGNFTSDTALTTSYNIDDRNAPGTVNITGITTGNGQCNAVSDQIVLDITPAPVVDAGSSEDICGDQTLLSLNGSVTIADGGVWSTPNGTGYFGANPSDEDDSTLVANTYTITSADSLAGGFDIILTSTGNGTCNPVSDTIRINIEHTPTVYAGEDITVCADSASVQLTSSYQVHTGIVWTTSGQGGFSVNEFDSTATYTFLGTDASSGGVTLTATTTDITLCPVAVDQVDITITPAPSVDPGGDRTVCADATTINLNGMVSVTGTGQWSTGNNEGNFSANDTVLNGTFTPSSGQISAGTVIITLTSTNNGQCNAVDSNFTFIINPAPIVDAGDPTGVCANSGSITLDGSVTNAEGGEWTSLGTPNYSFDDDTIMTTNYNYSSADSAAGTVTLILTSTGNDLCNAVTDSVTFTLQPLPTISASPDTVCGDINFNTPLSATFSDAGGMEWTTNVGLGDFITLNTDPNVEYDPDPADIGTPFIIYASTTGNGDCPAAVDSAIITIRNTPELYAGDDEIVCANNAAVSFDGTHTNLSAGQNILYTSSTSGLFNPATDATPADGVITTAYTVNGQDLNNGLSGSWIYMTTTNNGLCPAVKDSLKLLITPAPSVEIDSLFDICADHDTVNLSLKSLTTATSVAWTTDGDGSFIDSLQTGTNYILGSSDSSSAPTTITFTVITTEQGNCLPVMATKSIEVFPAPSLTVQSDNTICEDYEDWNYLATYTNTPGGNWTSNSDGDFGSYAGSTFTPDNRLDNVTYRFGVTDTAISTFTVYFTTIPTNGCYAHIDSAVNNITHAPTVEAADANVCASEDTIPLGATFTHTTGVIWSTTNGTGRWTDSLSAITNYIPSDADTLNSPIQIIVEPADLMGCLDKYDTLYVVISKPIIVSAGGNDTVCADTIGYTLNGTFSNSDTASWTTIDGFGSFSDTLDLNAVYTPDSLDIVNGSVTFVLETIGNGDCNSIFDTMVLTITPAPTLAIDVASTCTDEASLFLNSVYTVASGILWSTSSTDGGFIPGNTPTSVLDTVEHFIGANDVINQGFTVYIETSGEGLCKRYYDTLEVELTPIPTSEAGTDTSICFDADSLAVNGITFVDGGGGRAWTTSGNGTFADSSLSSTMYHFGDQDTVGGGVTLYLETTGGTCSPVTDSIVVTYTPIPTVFAGGQSVCIDNAAIPLNGIATNNGFSVTNVIWSTIGGDGLFDDSLTTSTTYNAGNNDRFVADSVVFVLATDSNGSCKTYYDTMTVHLDPGPLAIIEIDTVCADGVTIDLIGKGTSTTGFGIWTTLGNGIFNVGEDTLDVGIYNFGSADIDSGYVDLILNTNHNGDCDPHSDTARFVIDPAPIVDAGDSFTVCGDTSIIPLIGSVINFGNSGIWTTIDGVPANINSPTSLSTFYVPVGADTTRGSVSFVLSSTNNDLCNITRDTLVVTIIPIPIVEILDSLICADRTDIDLNATITASNGGSGTGIWTIDTSGVLDGNGTFNPNNQVNTKYFQGSDDLANSPVYLILTSTNNGLCKAYADTLELIITPPPTVEAGPTWAVCNDQDTVCMIGDFEVDNAATWYTLHDQTNNGFGTFAFGNNTDTNACYILGVNDTVGSSFHIYYETNGSSGCLPVKDSTLISISAGPTVDAGLPDTICADAGEIQLNGTYTVSGGIEWSTTTGGTFSDNLTDTNAIYNITSADSASGYVTVTIETTSNGTCLPVTDTVRHIIDPSPIVLLDNSYTVCADTVGVDIVGSVTVATGGAWTTSGSGSFNPDSIWIPLTDTVVTYVPSVSDINDSTVILTLTTTGNGLCNSIFSNTTLYITPAPTVNIPLDNIEVCADADSVPISGNVTIATGGIWASLGAGVTGTFANNGLLSTSFILGSDDIINGFVDLVLTTTGSGQCNEITDTMRITITDSVTVTANNDTIACESAESISLISTFAVAGGVIWTTSGDGEFLTSQVNDSITYEFSETDTTFSSITLTVTSTDYGTCKEQSDDIVITFDSMHVANAGEDITICADNLDVVLSGSVINSDGGIWSASSTTGSFADSSILGTTYTASDADVLNGLVNLVLTTNAFGVCAPDDSIIDLIINPAPTVEAGEPQEYCEDVIGIQLDGEWTEADGVVWKTSGDGVFVADSTDPKAIYERGPGDITAGTVTLTLCTTGNDLCQPVCDSMTYTILAGPTLEAGPNDTLCADAGEVVLVGASYDGLSTSNLFWTASTASGTFDDQTILTPTWTPDNAIIPSGTDPALVITFNLLNDQSASAGCTDLNDQRTTTFNPIPTIELGDDDTVCIDVDTIYLSANVTNATSSSWTTTGSGLFFPGGSNTGNGLNVTYVPSTSDRDNPLVFISETEGVGDCMQYEDRITVFWRERPIVTTLDKTVCANVTDVELSGAVTLSNGGTWAVLTSIGTGSTGSFSPSNTDLTGNYEPVPSDTVNNGPVFLTLTSDPYLDCKQYVDTMRIDFDPEPFVSAGDGSFCAAETGFQLDGSVSNASGVSWSGGDGEFYSPTDLDPFYVPGSVDMANDFARLYITSVTGNTCPDVTDSIDVIIIPLPEAEGSPTIQIVCRGSDAELFAILDSANATNYQWYSIDGVKLGGDNQPIVTVENITSDTVFVLEAIDKIYKSCTDYDTIEVHVFDPPALNLLPHYCLTDTMFMDANPVPDTLPNFYAWWHGDPEADQQVDAGNSTYAGTESGVYVFGFVYDQCAVYDTTLVTDPPEVEHEDEIVCIGQSIEIAATSPTGIVYDWIEEATGDTIAMNTNPVTVTADSDTINDQLFVVGVTDALGCITYDTVALTKLPPPIMELVNLPLCIGDEVTLNATPSNVIDSLLSGAVYNWFYQNDSIDGEHDSILDVLEAGTYMVEFGIGACKAYDTSVVDFHPLPIPDMQQKYEHCFDYEFEFNLSAGPADHYEWTATGTTDSIEIVYDYGFYEVTIYSEFNCEAKDTIEVVEVCEPRVFPPTGFIPNGQPCDPDCEDNDCNNCFFIKGGHYRNWNLSVYNRWGEVIFHSTDPDAIDGSGMWDGNYKGEPMPSGVYPWILYYEGDTPRHFGPYQIEGKITLIR